MYVCVTFKYVTTARCGVHGLEWDYTDTHSAAGPAVRSQGAGFPYFCITYRRGTIRGAVQSVFSNTYANTLSYLGP